MSVARFLILIFVAWSGVVIAASDCRENFSVLDRVERYLPGAIKSVRRFGIEVEFKGPKQKEVLEALEYELGGEIVTDSHPVVIQNRVFGVEKNFRLDTTGVSYNTKVITGETKSKFILEVTGSPEPRVFLSGNALMAYLVRHHGVNAQAVKTRLTGSRISLLAKSKAGNLYFRIYYNPETGRTKATLAEKPVEFEIPSIKNFKQVEHFARNLWGRRLRLEHSLLKDTPLGEINVTKEILGLDQIALELITEAGPYRGEVTAQQLQTINQTLGRLGARGTSKDLPVGLHASGEILGNRGPVIKHVMEDWHLHREQIVGTFPPHPSRKAFYNEQPYYGDFKPSLMEALKLIKNPSTGDLQRLFDQHYDSNPLKHLDINPFDAIKGTTPRLEGRLFNSNFDEPENAALQRKRIVFPVEFILSIIQRAEDKAKVLRQ